MLALNIFQPAEGGDKVSLPIQHPDRLCAIGPRNILGSIQNKRDDIYTVATSKGIISGCYSRNQFEIQPSNLISTPFSSEIVSQTEVMRNASLGAGVGVCSSKKCNNKSIHVEVLKKLALRKAIKENVF
ncbi:hypothetical protein LOD99_10898 [Oopsacas minuta]|uniref:Uncharacterized protein n=1 Tax=Oopsacas minuta TaxID=111878 RepID=A0AAV7KDE6_9METZ|nr:hypothetical protein LOD99_10898 [Oopsacas minuta]